MSTPREFVTVVSGLPRSGTSLVMQMLGAGGLPLFADGARPPDEDNPRGYFEYEPVKRIESDASFVAQAKGCALKVVVPLVRHLPATPRHRILLVTRRLDWVIASQEQMLDRRAGNRVGGIAPERLEQIYAAELAAARAWLASMGTPTLDVAHAALLEDPAASAAAIDAFLGGGLDRGAMAAVVDPRLHRQRG